MSEFKSFRPIDMNLIPISKNADLQWREELMRLHNIGQPMWTARLGAVTAFFGLLPLKEEASLLLWSVLPIEFKPFHARELRRALDGALKAVEMKLIIEVDPTFPGRETLAKFLKFERVDQLRWRRSS